MDRKNWIAFFAYTALLGGGPVAMRMIYSEMAPFWLGCMRYLLGAAVFWGLVIVNRLRIPSGRALLGPILYGIFGIGIPFILIGWGLMETTASMTSVLLATVPIMTIFLSAFQCIEALSGRGILGCFITIIGTIITVGGVSPTDMSFLHIGAIILGTFFLAEGGVILKRFPTGSPIMTNAIGVTTGAIVLVPISLLAGESWRLPALPETWAALGYLVVFVTVIAFILYLRVLKKWTASGASYSFVIVPIFTVIIAAAIAHEQVNLEFIIGSVFVLLGVVIGAISSKKHGIQAEKKPC